MRVGDFVVLLDGKALRDRDERASDEGTGRKRCGCCAPHVAERYLRGEITRDQIIDALTHWTYVPAETRTQDFTTTRWTTSRVPSTMSWRRLTTG